MKLIITCNWVDKENVINKLSWYDVNYKVRETFDNGVYEIVAQSKEDFFIEDMIKYGKLHNLEVIVA